MSALIVKLSSSPVPAIITLPSNVILPVAFVLPVTVTVFPAVTISLVPIPSGLISISLFVL